jgi:hypothetical protein
VTVKPCMAGRSFVGAAFRLTRCKRILSIAILLERRYLIVCQAGRVAVRKSQDQAGVAAINPIPAYNSSRRRAIV